MTLNSAVTRYVLTDPENGRKLFVAPNVEVLDGYSEPSAAIWADVYNSHSTLAAAKADVADWVGMLSDKEFVDDDEFDAESETPGIVLARVLRDGTVEMFYPTGDLPEVPEIPGGLEAGDIRKAEWLLDDFGIPASLVRPVYEAGPASCEIVARIHDRESIAESFDKELEDLEGDDLRQMFYPYTDADTGFTLDEISIAIDGEQATITLSGQVTDAVLLQLTASLAGRESGRDSDYAPEGVADAIFEVNYGANDAAGANDYGFEIMEWRDPAPAEELDGPGM